MTREESIDKIKEIFDLNAATDEAIKVYSEMRANAIETYGESVLDAWVNKGTDPEVIEASKQLNEAHKRVTDLAMKRLFAAPYFASLKPSELAAIRAHYGEGKSIAETAKAQGVTSRCICYRVEKAIKKLMTKD